MPNHGSQNVRAFYFPFCFHLKYWDFSVIKRKKIGFLLQPLWLAAVFFIFSTLYHFGCNCKYNPTPHLHLLCLLMRVQYHGGAHFTNCPLINMDYALHPYQDSLRDKQFMLNIIYLDFHSSKWALWTVDSWSHVLDQIQMYPDWDTIVQLLPTCQIQQHVISAWLN